MDACPDTNTTTPQGQPVNSKRRQLYYLQPRPTMKINILAQCRPGTTGECTEESVVTHRACYPSQEEMLMAQS